MAQYDFSKGYQEAKALELQELARVEAQRMQEQGAIDRLLLTQALQQESAYEAMYDMRDAASVEKATDPITGEITGYTMKRRPFLTETKGAMPGKEKYMTDAGLTQVGKTGVYQDEPNFRPGIGTGTMYKAPEPISTSVSKDKINEEYYVKEVIQKFENKAGFSPWEAEWEDRNVNLLKTITPSEKKVLLEEEYGRMQDEFLEGYGIQWDPDKKKFAFPSKYSKIMVKNGKMAGYYGSDIGEDLSIDEGPIREAWDKIALEQGHHPGDKPGTYKTIDPVFKGLDIDPSTGLPMKVGEELAEQQRRVAGLQYDLQEQMLDAATSSAGGLLGTLPEITTSIEQISEQYEGDNPPASLFFPHTWPKWIKYPVGAALTAGGIIGTPFTAGGSTTMTLGGLGLLGSAIYDEGTEAYSDPRIEEGVADVNKILDDIEENLEQYLNSSPDQLKAYMTILSKELIDPVTNNPIIDHPAVEKAVRRLKNLELRMAGGSKLQQYKSFLPLLGN